VLTNSLKPSGNLLCVRILPADVSRDELVVKDA
jgi:hypothetical protein